MTDTQMRRWQQLADNPKAVPPWGRCAPDSILLDRVPCHFGGSRSLFRCPYCEHRRALLYLPPNKTDFRCRTCAKLAHSVEAEDAPGRMWRKQRKLLARLGAEDRTDPQPPRPKGMHETTYRRLLEGIWAIEAWGDEQLYRFMRRSGLAGVR